MGNETFSVYFIPNHTHLAADTYDRIGFDDTFGRNNWADRAELKRTKPFIKEDNREDGPSDLIKGRGNARP